MNKFSHIWLAAVVFLIGCATGLANSQVGGKQPLRLVQTIPLPNVKGRIDHMEVDVKGERLFAAGLGKGTFGEGGPHGGEREGRKPRFKKTPRGFFSSDRHKTFFANGGGRGVKV